MCFASEPGWRVETVEGKVVISQRINPGGVVFSKEDKLGKISDNDWQVRARIPVPIAISLCQQIQGEQIDGFTVGGA